LANDANAAAMLVLPVPPLPLIITISFIIFPNIFAYL
jgi:hypothetical protein